MCMYIYTHLSLCIHVYIYIYIYMIYIYIYSHTDVYKYCTFCKGPRGYRTRARYPEVLFVLRTKFDSAVVAFQPFLLKAVQQYSLITFKQCSIMESATCSWEHHVLIELQTLSNFRTQKVQHGQKYNMCLQGLRTMKYSSGPTPPTAKSGYLLWNIPLPKKQTG